MKNLFIILFLLLFLLFAPIEALSKGKGGHSYRLHPKTYCYTCARDKHGKIKRDSNERKKFLKSKGLTHTPKGYQVDHIIPLAKGGADKAENMQLTPKDSEKERNELK